MTKTNEQWQAEVESLQCRLEIADMRINALVRAKGEAKRQLFNSTEAHARQMEDRAAGANACINEALGMAGAPAEQADINAALDRADAEDMARFPTQQGDGELPPNRELMALLEMDINTDLHDIMAMAAMRIKRLTAELAQRAVSGEAKPAVTEGCAGFQGKPVAECGPCAGQGCDSPAVPAQTGMPAVQGNNNYEPLFNRIDEALENYVRHGSICEFEGQPMIYASTLLEIGNLLGEVAPNKQPDSERDAARYRAMKKIDFTSEYSGYITDNLNMREHIDLDSVIDAAMVAATSQTREG